MSIDSTIQRVSTINSMLAEVGELAQGDTSSALTGGTAAPSSSSAGGSFADALQQASLELPGSPTAEDSTGTLGAEEASGLDPYALTGESPYTTGASTSLDAASPYSLAASSNPYVTGTSAYGATATGAAGGDAIGERIVQIAESQAGQAEEPLGSNEGAAIATYRSATAGAMPGAPWCAYFASWVARQAGEPIGSEGQGLGSVSEIWSWAQSTGRAITNGPGVVPKPGDLIVFGDEHVGIVRGVLPNGQIETVEGNYENKVALNVRSPSEPTGYVEMN
jgi:hypothetical protein